MVNYMRILVALLALCCADFVVSKIVLPHKLRYLENMLNADMQAKVNMRRRSESSPNLLESDNDWPKMMNNYQPNKMRDGQKNFFEMYQRRLPTL